MFRLLAAVLLAMALQGCSTLKFGYNQAPSLGYWWSSCTAGTVKKS